jgi:hypothetical protein
MDFSRATMTLKYVISQQGPIFFSGSTEPVFVYVYGAQKSIPPAYVAWPAGMTNRVVVPARQDGIRFMGSLKGLQIRAQLLW